MTNPYAPFGNVTLVPNPRLSDTLATMVAKAREARKSLRPLAEKICLDVEAGDYNSEIYAIYVWVDQCVRYAKDPHDVELVKAPHRIVEEVRTQGRGQGDCDDIACLCASLCMAMGHECRFVVVGFEQNVPSHVVCQACVRSAGNIDGVARGAKEWVTIDPVANRYIGQMHSRVQFAKVYGI